MKTVMNNVDIRQIRNTNIRELAIEALTVLGAGGVIVAPTETRYGLLCRADDKSVLEKLYRIKGRPEYMPCSVFVKSMEQLADWCVITNSAKKIAEKFWPGSVTMVLKAKAEFPPPVVADGKIGIRFSPEPFIVELLNNIDFPLTATSANLSGQPDLAVPGEIADSLGKAIDCYFDAGPREGDTSTVIDASESELVLLREGAIEFKNILEVN